MKPQQIETAARHILDLNQRNSFVRKMLRAEGLIQEAWALRTAAWADYRAATGNAKSTGSPYA